MASTRPCRDRRYKYAEPQRGQCKRCSICTGLVPMFNIVYDLRLNHAPAAFNVAEFPASCLSLLSFSVGRVSAHEMTAGLGGLVGGLI